MKTAIVVMTVCLALGALAAMPSANAVAVVGTGCSFASATVNGVAYFCSNLGQPGCTSLQAAGQTVAWCN